MLLARGLLEPGRGPAADVGTGGGCIALALAASAPWLRVLATDRSEPALELARQNAERLGLADRVRLVHADLFPPLGASEPGPTYQLIAANLPYVRPEEHGRLEPEVRNHDPIEALVADEGGLLEIRRLLAIAPERLDPGGWMLLELDPEQAPSVTEALASEGSWTAVRTEADRFDRRRFVVARRLAGPR